MKIERLKSILLVLLVISSIVLTVNKWFNEKLWPEGYNFFSDVKKHFASGSDEISSDFDPVEEILKPAQIILNNSGNHVLYTKSSPEYNALFKEIKSALVMTASATLPSVASSDEWNDNLKRKSCYFSYPVEYDSGYFFSQLSADFSSPVKTVKEFILSGDTRISSVVYMYVKDSSANTIFKHRLNFDSDTINDMIELASDVSPGINYYSFELNFDSETEDSVEQHIVIDPDVLINITAKQIPAIAEQNLFANIAEHPDIYNPLLLGFGYNTSTIRKYIEHNNSIVFVENYGTIKLHTDGVIDYKSLNSAEGIALGGDTVYDSINACISFVNAVSASLSFTDDMYCEISSDIKDINSKTYTLNFDYYINDNMIIIPDNDYEMNHAVTVEVAAGKIISYRQLCKNFYSLPSLMTCPSAIDAIDMLEESTGTSSDTISNIFTAYTYDSTKNIWSPSWYIENSSGEISTIATKPEV